MADRELAMKQKTTAMTKPRRARPIVAARPRTKRLDISRKSMNSPENSEGFSTTGEGEDCELMKEEGPSGNNVAKESNLQPAMSRGKLRPDLRFGFPPGAARVHFLLNSLSTVVLLSK